MPSTTVSKDAVTVNTVVTVLAILALVGLIVFIYFDQKKMSRKSTRNANVSHKPSIDATECVKRGIDLSSVIHDDLYSLLLTHCNRVNSFFKDTPVYENVVMASPAFLLVFSRLVLIANGILTRGTPKVEAATTTLYRRLLSSSDSSRFNTYVDYFQSFLPPNPKTPRCDIFNLDDSVLLSQNDNFAFILFVAFGDCIINPQLVTDGDSAPIVIYDAFELLDLESILMDQFSPYMSEFIDDLFGHFMRYHEYYSFSLRS